MSHASNLTNRRQFLKISGAAGVSTVATLGEFLIDDRYQPAEKQTIPLGLADVLLIDMVLNNLINRQFAEELKEYQTGHAVVHCDDDLNGVAIRLNHQFLNFKVVDRAIDPETGAKILMFREVDFDKETPITNELRIYFAGRSDANDDLGQKDDETVRTIISGKRSPQSAFVKHYIETTVKKYLEENTGLYISIFGHSLGAGNALYTKHLLSPLVNESISTTLFEPFAATHEAGFILQNGNQDQVSQLQQSVFTIRSNPPTYIGGLEVATSVGNKAFGEDFFYIDSSGGDTYAPGSVTGIMVGAFASAGLAGGRQLITSRRGALANLSKLFLTTAVATTMPISTYLGDQLYRAKFKDNFHDLAANFNLVYENRQALQQANNSQKILANADEVLHPEKYPIPPFQSAKAEITGRAL